MDLPIYRGIITISIVLFLLYKSIRILYLPLRRNAPVIASVYVVDFFEGRGSVLPFPAFENAGLHRHSFDDEGGRFARDHRHGIDRRSKIRIDDGDVVVSCEGQSEGHRYHGEYRKESRNLEVGVQRHLGMPVFHEPSNQSRDGDPEHGEEGSKRGDEKHRKNREIEPPELERAKSEPVKPRFRMGLERYEEPGHGLVFLVVLGSVDGQKEFYEIVEFRFFIEHRRKPFDKERSDEFHKKRSVQKRRERFYVFEVRKIVGSAVRSGNDAGAAFDFVEGFPWQKRNSEKDVHQIEGIVIDYPLAKHVQKPLAINGVASHCQVDFGNEGKLLGNARIPQ